MIIGKENLFIYIGIPERTKNKPPLHQFPSCGKSILGGRKHGGDI
jgi:hypothetical protein